MVYQHTIQSPVSFEGVGLHTGVRTKVIVRPGSPNTGVLFVRSDLPARPTIPARQDYLWDNRLATTVGHDGVTVSTIEHLMAAFFALGIHNAIVEVAGPEVPIADGSSTPFVTILQKARIVPQNVAWRTCTITAEIELHDGDSFVKLSPGKTFRLDVKVQFDHPMIGRQRILLDYSSRQFIEKICPARTFGFVEQVELLKAQGFARGGSLENAIVLDHQGVINQEGLRFKDEFARHKLLDLVGDLSLCGMRVIGTIEAYKPSHRLNHEVVRSLTQRQDCVLISMAGLTRADPSFDTRQEMTTAPHMLRAEKQR